MTSAMPVPIDVKLMNVAASALFTVTIPGKVFFLPNEAPRPIADVIARALAKVS